MRSRRRGVEGRRRLELLLPALSALNSIVIIAIASVSITSAFVIVVAIIFFFLIIKVLVRVGVKAFESSAWCIASSLLS